MKRLARTLFFAGALAIVMAGSLDYLLGQTGSPSYGLLISGAVALLVSWWWPAKLHADDEQDDRSLR